MSKKRSKKFEKKRAPAAMVGGADSPSARHDDADDTNEADAPDATQAGLMAAAALHADHDDAIALAVLAEGSVGTDAQDVIATQPAADEANAAEASLTDSASDHDATSKRSKKNQKAAVRAAQSAAVSDLEAALDADVGLHKDAVVEAADPAIEVDAAVEADSAVEKTRKGGKKANAKGKAKQVAALADTASDDADVGLTSAAFDNDAVATAYGIDVEMVVDGTPTNAELAAAGYDDELASDAIDGIDVEMPDLLDGENAEAAVEGEEVESELPAAAAAMDAAQLAQLIEALIFATDKPLTLQRIRQLTRVADVNRITAALAKIAVDYADRGIVLSSVSGGYQFRTRSQFSSWVQQLIAGRPVRLSRAQLEALAIIAYRQPITRPEMDEIRGVDSGGTLKVLLDRQLIRSLGKKEEVGRPVLYGTTKEFLDFFSLGDLRELPTLREYSELTDESRSVMKKMGLDAPEGVPTATGGPQGLTPDDAAAFEALANAAEIANEFDEIGEVGDVDEVIDFGVESQFAATRDRSGVVQDDHDVADDSMALASDEQAADTERSTGDVLDAGDELDMSAGERDNSAQADGEGDEPVSTDASAATTQGFDPTNLARAEGDDVDDDDAIELPSWVVPVADPASDEGEIQGPGMVLSREHGDSDEDALAAEVTRDGEWMAESSERVEPTDDVSAEQFDDDVS